MEFHRLRRSMLWSPCSRRGRVMVWLDWSRVAVRLRTAKVNLSCSAAGLEEVGRGVEAAAERSRRLLALARSSLRATVRPHAEKRAGDTRLIAGTERKPSELRMRCSTMKIEPALPRSRRARSALRSSRSAWLARVAMVMLCRAAGGRGRPRSG